MARFIPSLFLLLLLQRCSSIDSRVDKEVLFDTSKSTSFQGIHTDKFLVDTTLFSSPEIVFLETNIESLVQEVSKVLVSDSNVWVFDRKTSKVSKFNYRGGFIKNLQSIGRGPREYRKILDCVIDNERKELFVLCEYPYKIYVYDYDFNFIREIVNNRLYLEIAVLEDKIYCRSSPMSNDKMNAFHVEVKDRCSGDVLDYILPIITKGNKGKVDYQNISVDRGSLLTNGKELLISIPDRNFVYALKDKDYAGPKYTFSELSTTDDHQVKGIYNFVETDTYLFFKNNSTFCVANKDTNNLVKYEYGVFTYIFDGAMDRLVSSNYKDGLVFSVYPDFLLRVRNMILDHADEEMELNYKMLNFASNITENSNPVLFFYKIK